MTGGPVVGPDLSRSGGQSMIISEQRPAERPPWWGSALHVARTAAVEQRLEKLAREWTALHSEPASAGNLELLAMNVARFQTCVDAVIDELNLRYPDDGQRPEWDELADAVGESSEAVSRVYATCCCWWDLVAPEFSVTIGQFLTRWLRNGFPRLELSHKYAAALCCTDVPPDVEVRPPWPAWSLVLPSELLGPGRLLGRVWIDGTTWVANVWQGGEFECVNTASVATASTAIMIENLIRGACLSLSDPEAHRKQQGGQSQKSHGNNRKGPPDLTQARYMLAPPVRVDLRAHIVEALAGGGTAPKVQFLVRGHWRQQAHGPGRTLRKPIWIEPFWKGPEDSRILLRSHKLGDDAGGSEK